MLAAYGVVNGTLTVGEFCLGQRFADAAVSFR